jgi:hypothetical protein
LPKTRGMVPEMRLLRTTKLSRRVRLPRDGGAPPEMLLLDTSRLRRRASSPTTAGMTPEMLMLPRVSPTTCSRHRSHGSAPYPFLDVGNKCTTTVNEQTYTPTRWVESLGFYMAVVTSASFLENQIEVGRDDSLYDVIGQDPRHGQAAGCR